MLKRINTSSLAHAVSFVILLSFANSCTVYYKTSDVKKTFTQATKESSKSLTQIKKDHAEKQAMYDELTSLTSDPALAPYPELARHLQEMTQHLMSVELSQGNFIALKDEFSRLAKGKKKIESNSPLYKKYKSIKAEYEALSTEFEKKTKAYQLSSNAFISVANKYKISSVKIPELNKQLATYIKELDQNILEISDGISKSREMLAEMQTRGASKKTLNAKQSTLVQLEQIVAEVAVMREELQDLTTAFENEVSGKTEVWSGPGMRTYTIMNDMTTLGAEITKAGKKFNEQSKQL